MFPFNRRPRTQYLFLCTLYPVFLLFWAAYWLWFNKYSIDFRFKSAPSNFLTYLFARLSVDTFSIVLLFTLGLCCQQWVALVPCVILQTGVAALNTVISTKNLVKTLPRDMGPADMGEWSLILGETLVPVVWVTLALYGILVLRLLKITQHSDFYGPQDNNQYDESIDTNHQSLINNNQSISFDAQKLLARTPGSETTPNQSINTSRAVHNHRSSNQMHGNNLNVNVNLIANKRSTTNSQSINENQSRTKNQKLNSSAANKREHRILVRQAESERNNQRLNEQRRLKDESHVSDAKGPDVMIMTAVTNRVVGQF